MAQPSKLPRFAGSTANPPVATSGATVEPTEGKKTAGFAAVEEPPAQTLNWLFYWILAWCNYVKYLVTEPLIWTVQQKFSVAWASDDDCLQALDGDAEPRGGFDHIGFQKLRAATHQECWRESKSITTATAFSLGWSTKATNIGSAGVAANATGAGGSAAIPYCAVSIGEKVSNDNNYYLVTDNEVVTGNNADILFAVEWIASVDYGGVNNVSLFMGLDDSANGSDAFKSGNFSSKGAYFEVASNGFIHGLVSDGTTQSDTASAVKPLAGVWHRYRIEIFGSNTVLAKVRLLLDGVQIHSDNVHFPPANLRLAFGGVATGAAAHSPASEVINLGPVQWSASLPVA